MHIFAQSLRGAGRRTLEAAPLLTCRSTTARRACEAVHAYVAKLSLREAHQARQVPLSLAKLRRRVLAALRQPWRPGAALAGTVQR